MSDKVAAIDKADVVIRELELKDALLAGNVLTKAYADDPGEQWVYGGKPRPPEIWKRLIGNSLFTASIAETIINMKGRVWTLVNKNTNEIIGVAIWLSPYFEKFNVAAKALANPKLWIKQFSIASRVFTSLSAKSRFRDKNLHQNKHYFLTNLGIEPKYQRQGLGKRIQAVLTFRQLNARTATSNQRC